MKRSTIIVISVILATAVIGTLVYFRYTYFPKHRWNIDYKKNSDEPYGTLYFYNAVKEQDAGTTLIFNQAYWQLDDQATGSNFIYIGPGLQVDSSQAGALLEFVARGNRALIATDGTPFNLLNMLLPPGDTARTFQLISYHAARVKFTDDDVTLHFNFQNLKDTAALYSWGGYTIPYFSDTLSRFGFTPIATINDTLVTVFSVDHGKGKFIVHANPITFTNYHLVKKQGYQHAAKMLATLHEGPTYWDDRSPGKTGYSKALHKNPLKLLFSHPHLSWAWYLFLLTVLLYIIFRSKREQRVIPLMPSNQNDSLAFVKTLGTLYFKHGGQKHIAGEMYTLFMADLRTRYNIFTDIPQKELIMQVAERSGVPLTEVQELFREFNYVKKAHSATRNDLLSLHGKIETFNKKRK